MKLGKILKTMKGTIRFQISERREVANCIKARYDAGISNLRSEGNCVIESG